MPGHDTMAAVPRVRRVIAIVLAFAALAPLLLPRLATDSVGSGGDTSDGPGVTYSFGELTFADHWRDMALALAIAIGAAAIWAARDRRVLGAGVAIGLAGLALTPVAVAQERTDTVSAATDRAIRIGMSRDEVRATAGRPAGGGEAVLRSGKRLRCLVYLGASYDRYLYCFAGDRLVEKR